MAEEGVIKFDLRHRNTRAAESPEDLHVLNAWREVLWRLHLVGQDPERYGGYGFGNVSLRLAPFDAPVNRRRFLISATQTGGLAALDDIHYTVIDEYDPAKNRIVSTGALPPSSESLTHGMIYNMDDDIRAILHVHSPDIWKSAGEAGIPITDARVAYGTPEMAVEVARLFRQTNVRQSRLFAMGGHRDGMIAFGTTADEAGRVLIDALVASLALQQVRHSAGNNTRHTNTT
jgi:ribulose-5-phosphate 4-epimerase/fuculose-1-phosphate aldolase